MRRAASLAGLIPVLAAVACGSIYSCPTDCNLVWRPPVAEPGKPVPASAVSRLTGIADSVATEDGGRPVAWATVVVTTRAKALTSATPGDLVPNDEKTVVYLITMKGNFTDYGYSGPAESHAPTGRYVSVVLSAKTFESTDGGISKNPPPVAPASLGPVTHLKIHPSPRKRS
jgi:hypothetical protein